MIYEYDERGLMQKASNETGDIWIWEYDENGNMIHHKGPGNEFWKEYDELNREVKYICGENVVISTYSENGLQTQTQVELL